MRRRLPVVATLPAVHAAHLPVLAGAWLVVVAGLNKLWRPDPTTRAVTIVLAPIARQASVGRVVARVFGIVEIVVGIGVLASSATAWTWALGALYALFACFVVLALATGAPLQSCGCFGARDRAPSAVHVALDAGVAALGIAVVTDASIGAPHRSFVAHHALGAALSAGIALVVVLTLRGQGTSSSTQ
jgi:hypothetical protein